MSLKEVRTTKKYIESMYRYEMFEDVHQVANYLELKKKANPNDRLTKEYAFMSKRIVLMSLIIQLVLVINLAYEVFQKIVTPSGQILFLRMVLIVFMIFLFNSEQTSIEKTNQLIVLNKVGWFITIANFFR